jgi:serine/threonine protein kinase
MSAYVHQSVKHITSQEELSDNKIFYVEQIQIGTDIELYYIIHKGILCVTKRTKIGDNGFVCPHFLREINILKKLSNPPDNLRDHPGRNNIIKLLNVYTLLGYLHFDIECANGTLCYLKNNFNITQMKENILIDISNAIHYIHALDFNHYDISMLNIMYIIDNDTNDTERYRFVLIDFGNSIHKTRPLTAREPTYYISSIEMIDVVTLVTKIQNLIWINQNNDIVNIHNLIKNEIMNVNSFFFHQKSDIWSLGAISYYLNCYEYYADGVNLEQQRMLILDRDKFSSKLPINNYCEEDKEILSKTLNMLIAKPNDRPIVYFNQIENNTIIDTSQIQPSTYSPDIFHDKMNCIGNYINTEFDLEQYKIIITDLITSVSITTNRLFLLDFLDDVTIKSVIHMCYKIELKCSEIITNNIIEHINLFFNNTNHTLCIKSVWELIRLVILWLVSHMFVNNVWSIFDITKYLQQKQYINIDQIDNNINFITFLCTTICGTIDWCFE